VPNMLLTITDNFAYPDEVDLALDEWPASGWVGWHTYESGKRVSKPDMQDCPLPIAKLLHRMAKHSFGCLPDLSLWGAGLHEIPVGCELGLHRDAEREPRLGLKRMLSGVLYLEGTGDLHIEPGITVAPVPGRFVTFDGSHKHRVGRVAQTRRMLTMFYYGPPMEGGDTRADFFGGVR
jgi:hypothetical protein